MHLVSFCAALALAFAPVIVDDHQDPPPPPRPTYGGGNANAQPHWANGTLPATGPCTGLNKEAWTNAENKLRELLRPGTQPDDYEIQPGPDGVFGTPDDHIDSGDAQKQ